MLGHLGNETLLSQGTNELLAYVVQRVVDGTAAPTEVTTVLRRVCDESRHRQPEVLVLRIKELWAKVAGTPGPAPYERDRRYFALIGEALVLYFGSSAVAPRRPPFFHADVCGEPESITVG